MPRQTRLFALLNVAMADAGAACWNAKFQTGWWDPRPINAIRDLGLDAAWEPYLGTPLFPAYPSGTSNYSGAAGEVLAHVFPDDAKMWRARAIEAGMSRLWGGVHWRIDVEQGLKMGRQVGGLVGRARDDPTAPSDERGASSRRCVALALLVAGSRRRRRRRRDGERRRDPFTEVSRQPSLTRTARRAAPRWERVARLHGTAPATEPVSIARGAIQWRARWRCSSGRLALAVEPAPRSAAERSGGRCPGAGEATWVQTGEQRLRVERDRALERRRRAAGRHADRRADRWRRCGARRAPAGRRELLRRSSAQGSGRARLYRLRRRPRRAAAGPVQDVRRTPTCSCGSARQRARGRRRQVVSGAAAGPADRAEVDDRPAELRAARGRRPAPDRARSRSGATRSRSSTRSRRSAGDAARELLAPARAVEIAADDHDPAQARLAGLPGAARRLFDVGLDAVHDLALLLAGECEDRLDAEQIRAHGA